MIKEQGHNWPVFTTDIKENYSGWVQPSIGTQPRIVKSAPGSCPIPSVQVYDLFVKEGTHLKPAISYMQSLAQVIFVADSLSHADKIRKKIENWSAKNFSAKNFSIVKCE